VKTTKPYTKEDIGAMIAKITALSVESTSTLPATPNTTAPVPARPTTSRAVTGGAAKLGNSKVASTIIGAFALSLGFMLL